MLWVDREVAAPAAVAWLLLSDPDRWPEWGPTVRRAELDGDRLGLGATGRVTTVVGISLPFRVTGYEEGRRWSWRVAGIPATDHLVENQGADRCRVAIGVPLLAAPYAAVCRLALRRIERLATGDPARGDPA